MLKATAQLYKNAYLGLSRKTWLLSIVMLINRSGTMVIPFMTIYCTQQLHFSIPQAGFVMALFGAGAIVGAAIGGRITDRFGFYPLQVASLFSGGVMFIVTGYMHSYAALCISTFILSVCNESFRPANATAIAFYSKPENRTRSYSLNRLAINLGWAAGSALGGFLASKNYILLFWVDGCTNIAAGFLLLRLLPYVKSGTKHIIPEKKEHTAAPAYKDNIYLLFIALTILFAACFFLMFTLTPVYYKTEWHLNEPFIGFLMALNGIIICIIEMALVFKLEGSKPHTFFIGRGVIIVGIGYVILNLLPSLKPVALLSITLITFGEILSMPFMNSFWVGRTSENNRGQYAAMYTIAWSIAQIAAPSLGSLLADSKGFDTLWYTVFFICAIAGIGFLLLGSQQKKLQAKFAS